MTELEEYKSALACHVEVTNAAWRNEAKQRARAESLQAEIFDVRKEMERAGIECETHIAYIEALKNDKYQLERERIDLIFSITDRLIRHFEQFAKGGYWKNEEITKEIEYVLGTVPSPLENSKNRNGSVDSYNSP